MQVAPPPVTGWLVHPAIGAPPSRNATVPDVEIGPVWAGVTGAIKATVWPTPGVGFNTASAVAVESLPMLSKTGDVVAEGWKLESAGV